MANGRMESRCDGCGATDDHPKQHYPPHTFHHDCIPAFVIDDLTSETTWRFDEATRGYVQADRVFLADEDLPEHAKRVLSIRKKAMDGTRGHDLLAHILTMDHGQNDEES